MSTVFALLSSLFVVHASGSSYVAHHELPCGMSVLRLEGVPSADGPSDGLMVRVIGVSPIDLLSYDVLLRARVRVFGVLTGEVRDDAECGPMPVFLAIGFEPIGPVRRTFCSACLDGNLQIYNGNRPTDRYVAEDFVGGPEAHLLDGERCRPAPSSRVCRSGEVLQLDDLGSDEHERAPLCCPFLE